MIFSSIFFIFVFLPLTLLAYYLVPFRFKNAVLLIFSLIFYAWGEPVYVILMLLSVLLNYVSGLELEILLNRGAYKKARKALIFSVILNIGVLGFYKYYGFVLGILNAILPVEIPYTELALPIGISFYTFQALSYVIDVYRGKVEAQHDLVSFGAYVTMFPQLIAGPIVRYSDVAEQLSQREISKEKFQEGTVWFLRGLGKKVLIADNMGLVFNGILALGASQTSALSAWIGVFAYTMQIYFDFGGYSDMAIGLGKMLGFEFRKNFDYPYLSKSITEFWNRWHISLGSWFKDYVYIPLGGNRSSSKKAVRNLLIVWVLIGLWHGASGNFVFWGLYYGVILCLEKYVLNKVSDRIPNALKHICTMIIVMVGWVFFAVPTMKGAFSYLGTMVCIGGSGIIDMAGFYYFKTTFILGLIAVFCSAPATFQSFERLAYSRNSYNRVLYVGFYVLIFVMSVAYLMNATHNPFLYFRF